MEKQCYQVKWFIHAIQTAPCDFGWAEEEEKFGEKLYTSLQFIVLGGLWAAKDRSDMCL